MLDKDLMPIKLADLIPDDSSIEQQSDCDSAAYIELENLNDIFEDDLRVDLRDNTCKIFSSVGLTLIFPINQYLSVCNSVITFVLWTYMFLWMIIYTLD